MVLCLWGWIKSHWITGLTITGVATAIGGLLMWGRHYQNEKKRGTLLDAQIANENAKTKEREQLADDESKSDGIKERFDVLISEERLAKNVAGGFQIPNVEWFIQKMPEYEVRLIKKIYKEWKGTRTYHSAKSKYL